MSRLENMGRMQGLFMGLTFRWLRTATDVTTMCVEECYLPRQELEHSVSPVAHCRVSVPKNPHLVAHVEKRVIDEGSA